MLKVVVYSDYICPFCYIGYHRINRLRKEFEFDTDWRSFELHPEIPKAGAYTDQLSFPPGYIEMAMANVKRLADDAGVKIRFSGFIPNSRLALYISEFARIKGKFDEFHELVFKKYWEEGGNIGDLEILLNLGENIDLNREEILIYLESEEPVKKVKQYSEELNKYGINGVPTFIIGEKIVIGAQPYEVFKKIISHVISEDEAS
jgi:predicted DsbA family dithiol-disulfide isomerase